MYKNHDEAMRAEEESDLQDKYEEAVSGSAVSMSVREYAQLRGITPQRVYYYVRQRRITVKPCGECGRKVIDIQEADAIFVKKDEDNGD